MPTIALDITRLLHAPFAPAPRGIDRVELLYANHFMTDWPGQCFAVAPTLLGVRYFDRRHAIKLVRAVERLWGENSGITADRRYDAVRDWVLTGHRDRIAAMQDPSPAYGFMRGSAALLGSLRSIGHPVRRLPERSIYLNVGHYALSIPGYLRWLRHRRDISAVFMLHDAIPLEFPHYVSAQDTEAHRKRFNVAARHATALLANSETSRGQVMRFMARENGRTDLTTHAVPLPVSPAFTEPVEDDAALRAVPYFVVCGAIEPRKNHELLLAVWQKLASEGGTVPKLLIVGTRERTPPAVAAMLDRCPPLQQHVLEVRGLSTPGLCRILRHARALLMPSFAEGFGLPVAEALALGTPAIASDIPAHHEAGGTRALYLDPTDTDAWTRAARDHARQNIRAPGGPSRTWRDYFGKVEAFLSTVSDQKSA